MNFSTYLDNRNKRRHILKQLCWYRNKWKSHVAIFREAHKSAFFITLDEFETEIKIYEQKLKGLL